MSTGCILWQNKSIVCIATGFKGKSANVKTGEMVQTWIMVKDQHPVEASETGKDCLVCGDCPRRHYLGGDCYVNLMLGPASVWKAWKRGVYSCAPRNLTNLFSGEFVRLGSYGDPVFVPRWVWDKVLAASSGHTGYTHQWHKNPSYKDILMASVDTEEQYIAALAQGWRTFRSRRPGDRKMQYEFECPASKEQNYRLKCIDCMACSGSKSRGRACPTIIDHGLFLSSKKVFYPLPLI